MRAAVRMMKKPKINTVQDNRLALKPFETMIGLLPLEVNLDGLVYFLGLIMFGPALLFLIIGAILFSKEKKKGGKIFMILAGVYLIISLGTCGALMAAN
ncbi:hypothetical protein ACFQZJ_19435 [Maribacter chungangensis]|uniref:DUF4190 domain-containing protein n=1 Tax=Maribacter chungangensis TaxID=1069117 RepID=A0ABW3B9S0_9FLAO